MTVSDIGNEAPAIVAKIHFGKIHVSGHRSVHVSTLSLRELASLPDVRVLFCANPSSAELLTIALYKFLLRPRLRVAVFDLILRRPETLFERLMASVKARMLRAIDLFLFIHKDTRGYQRHYGIAHDKCRYVAFKANNLDLIDSVAAVDGDYVLSCGASHRDFDTLLRAVEPLGYRTVIVLSDKAAKEHNARLDERLIPACVERIRNVEGRIAWSELIARSRIVVVPILPGTLQPAGISVYLEAMAMNKPVVVSSGSSTEGILSNDLAITVPGGDANALREAIRTLWESESARRRLGEAARAFAVGLGGNERMTKEIEAHIARLCAEAS